MSSVLPLTTTEIRDLFAAEIKLLGGDVRDVFDDGARLFMRSVLPELRHVGHDDAVQGGVALRMTEQEIRVNPYVFRLVCKNGAIMAHALQATTVENTCEGAALRDAIRACGSAEAFTASADQMRAAQDVQADLALNLAPLLAAMGQEFAAAQMAELLDNLVNATDRSRFGMMNAITAVAREIPDPDLRWRLEEYGGGVAVGIVPTSHRSGGVARSLTAMMEVFSAERPTDIYDLERQLLVAAVA